MFSDQIINVEISNGRLSGNSLNIQKFKTQITNGLKRKSQGQFKNIFSKMKMKIQYIKICGTQLKCSEEYLQLYYLYLKISSQQSKLLPQEIREKSLIKGKK